MHTSGLHPTLSIPSCSHSYPPTPPWRNRLIKKSHLHRIYTDISAISVTLCNSTSSCLWCTRQDYILLYPFHHSHTPILHHHVQSVKLFTSTFMFLQHLLKYTNRKTIKQQKHTSHFSAQCLQHLNITKAKMLFLWCFITTNIDRALDRHHHASGIRDFYLATYWSFLTPVLHHRNHHNLAFDCSSQRRLGKS